MTDAPIAQTIHPGGQAPAGWRQQALAQWLPANGINPSLICASDPILILPVPYDRPGSEAGAWVLQVIAFHQFHVDSAGVPERNLITGRQITFQRTVPLSVPFPTDPTTDGEDHGQADGQTAQEAPEERVRPARETQAPGGHEGEGPQRPGEGSTERIEGNPEEDQGQGHQAVPEPEEDRRQEEEVAAL